MANIFHLTDQRNEGSVGVYSIVVMISSSSRVGGASLG